MSLTSKYRDYHKAVIFHEDGSSEEYILKDTSKKNLYNENRKVLVKWYRSTYPEAKNLSVKEIMEKLSKLIDEQNANKYLEKHPELEGLSLDEVLEIRNEELDNIIKENSSIVKGYISDHKHMCDVCDDKIFFSCDKVHDQATNGFQDFRTYDADIKECIQIYYYDKLGKERIDRIRVVNCLDCNVSYDDLYSLIEYWNGGKKL